jgi:hypothetical protein
LGFATLNPTYYTNEKLELPLNLRDTRMHSTFSKFSLILVLSLCINTAKAESHVAFDFSIFEEDANQAISPGWSGYPPALPVSINLPYG